MINEKVLDGVLQEIIARWGIPGLGVGIVEGAQTVGHGGGGFGWTCFLALLPEKNVPPSSYTMRNLRHTPGHCKPSKMTRPTFSERMNWSHSSTS